MGWRAMNPWRAASGSSNAAIRPSSEGVAICPGTIATPSLDGPTALLDCEDGSRLDVDAAPRIVAGYRERLARLGASLEGAARAAGARFARVTAGAPERMFADHLLPQGLVEPAA